MSFRATSIESAHFPGRRYNAIWAKIPGLTMSDTFEASATKEKIQRQSKGRMLISQQSYLDAEGKRKRDGIWAPRADFHHVVWGWTHWKTCAKRMTSGLRRAIDSYINIHTMPAMVKHHYDGMILVTMAQPVAWGLPFDKFKLENDKCYKIGYRLAHQQCCKVGGTLL